MKRPAHSEGSLHRRILEDAYDRLPPVLRRFHDAPCGGSAQGAFRITRGHGWLRHALASMMRLPSPGENVPVRLQVQVRGTEEIWIRDFGAQRLVTRLWQEEDLLIEAAGPLRFGYRLSADAREMHTVSTRCWLLGIPLPSALAPRVNACASAEEAGWWVCVRVEVPVLGQMAHYEGEVTPQW